MNAYSKLSASEAAYLGEPVAHVAARDDAARLARRLDECAAAMTGNGARDFMRLFAAIEEDVRITGKANLPGDGGMIVR